MSARRDALIARFRVGSIDRVRRVSAMLVALAQADAGLEQAADVARELHTLKGEARMLGFGDASDLAHAVEARLVPEGNLAVPPPDACADMIEALDALARALEGRLGPPEQTTEALHRIAAKLESAAQDAAQRSSVEVGSERREASRRDAARASGERWVQVRASHVEELCERVAALSSDLRALAARVRPPPMRGESHEGREIRDRFDGCIRDLESLEESAWGLRMMPVDPMLQEIAQHARELARKQNKRLRVVLLQRDVLLERDVLDTLFDPMLHLVQNAVDHGIEPEAERGDKGAEATLTIAAEPAGASVILSVTDDGRGISIEAVRQAAVMRGIVSAARAPGLSEAEVLDLVFEQGFSTRDDVSEISGRGVGLGVVRAAAEKVGGRTGVWTDPGRGTRFTLVVPAKVSKERMLVIDVGGGALFALPARDVLCVMTRKEATPYKTEQGGFARFRDKSVPCRSLAELLAPGGAQDEPWVLVVFSPSGKVALETAALVGERELVSRPVDELLASSGFVRSSTVLEDGRVIPILSIGGLLRRAPVRHAAPSPPSVRRAIEVLVVDDSAIARDLVSDILTAAGLSVQTACDGASALAAVEARRPDVVVTDVEMPGIDGYELLKRLRSQLPALPVILLTTRAGARDRELALSLGAQAYLVKAEFREQKLLQTILRVTEIAA